MTDIKKNSGIITLINVFTVEAENQEKLIDLLIEATKKVINKQEGFISANIHKSLDGTRVVNYAQWKSQEAFEKILKNPKAIIHMDEILNIAKADGRLYNMVFIDDLTS